MTSTSRRARSRSTRYQLVGGKGGVGKTTCAAAMAIHAARDGARTLVLSTDPASSLGDALGLRLSAAPRPVPSTAGRLHAADVHARTVITRWLRPRTPVLEDIGVRGTWLDRSDMSDLLRLSLPGIDELAALLEITRHGRSARYDLIVVDSAPTGHMLRMLGTADALGAIARVFEAMQARHRAIVVALRGRWDSDAADALIASLERDAQDLASLLRDPSRLSVSWVSLPEAMAVEETADALDALSASGLIVERVIVNRTVAARPGPACAWCAARERYERRTVSRLRTRLRRAGSAPSARFIAVRERPAEPVGVRALAAIGVELAAMHSVQGVTGRAPRRITADVSFVQGTPCGALDRPELRLLMFGGKGGVGKTTCAAAAAIDAALRDGAKRVLLLSTDPAHSLGDVLRTAATDVAASSAGVPRNLHVRELDAVRSFQRVRDEYSEAIDAVFDRLARGTPVDATYDRRVMRSLLDLAPPGIDELVGMLEVTSALERASPSAYDLVVMDTAPTGHALRLLEMPSLVQEWTKALMRILLKYQPLVPAGSLGEALVRLSRQIARLRAELASGAATFVLVTRLAELARLESGRLLRRLRSLNIDVSAVVANAVGAGACARCAAQSTADRTALRRLHASVRTASGVRLLAIAPAEYPPPRGGAALRSWRGRWVCAEL